MKHDEKSQSDAKDNDWNEEVTIGEDRAGLVKKSHLHPDGVLDSDRRQHKDATQDCQDGKCPRAAFK